MYRYLLILLLISSGCFAQKAKKPSASATYYPEKEWLHKKAEEVGINSQKLKEAVEFAIASEAKSPKNLEQNHYQTFGREPFGDAIGPLKDRGAATGLIIKNGYIVSEWGVPSQSLVWRNILSHVMVLLCTVSKRESS